MTDDLPLTQLLAKNQMTVSDLIRRAIQIGSALRRLHADGRCHGALTPELIQMGESSARLLPPSPDSAGEITPYTAPEVLRGYAVDTRTDIFAFGAVLYEMATGHRAFRADDPEILKEEILIREVPPVGHDALDRVIARCLEKDPALRWPKMQTALMELKLVVLSEQQPEISIAAQLEAAVGSELSRQAGAIAQLDRAVSAHAAELQRMVTAVVEEVQSQFAEVEKFLTASLERGDHFALSAASLVEGAQKQIAALEERVAGDLNVLARKVDEQASTVESLRDSISWNEDCVDRVVDAVEGIHNAIFKQVPRPHPIPVALAS